MKIKKLSIGGEAFYPATIAAAIKDPHRSGNPTQSSINADTETRLSTCETDIDNKVGMADSTDSTVGTISVCVASSLPSDAASHPNILYIITGS